MQNHTTQLDIFDLPEVCSHPGCTTILEPRKRANGMCWNHYMAWRRKNKRNHERVCKNCGTTFYTHTAEHTVCSPQCQRVFASAAGVERNIEIAETKTRECARPDCYNTFLRAEGIKNKYCSQDCLDVVFARATGGKSALRQAIEDNDYPRVITEVSTRVSTDNPLGCWLWQGAKTRGKNGGHYPNLKYTRVVKGKKKYLTHQVHRLIVEAKYGKPLGSQHAHHICSVSMCVNPDHLEPITMAQNMGEMLQRTSYLKYIAEIQDVVRNELSPDHPILNRIELF